MEQERGEPRYKKGKIEITLLGIFKDTIQSNFRSLSDTKKRTRIDMVERCINKKQYQQALTLFESALPEYYREDGIISFSFVAENIVKNLIILSMIVFYLRTSMNYLEKLLLIFVLQLATIKNGRKRL
jgi:hypothetical protein